MKKVIYLIFLVFTYSCSKNNSFENKDFSNDVVKVKDYSSESLIKEKFLEFYDLNILLENDTLFKKNIKQRLNSFLLDTSEVFNFKNNAKIKNLTVLKTNSETNMKLLIDLEINNKLIKDSVLTSIVKEEFILDSTKVISTKVKFYKFKN